MIPPSSPRENVAKYTSSVPTRPISTTSTPDVGKTPAESSGKPRTGQTDVVADNHLAWAYESSVSTPDEFGHLFVQLVRYPAAHIVRFEALQTCPIISHW